MHIPLERQPAISLRLTPRLLLLLLLDAAAATDPIHLLTWSHLRTATLTTLPISCFLLLLLLLSPLGHLGLFDDPALVSSRPSVRASSALSDKTTHQVSFFLFYFFATRQVFFSERPSK
jgi:hypothetical protein